MKKLTIFLMICLMTGLSFGVDYNVVQANFKGDLDVADTLTAYIVYISSDGDTLKIDCYDQLYIIDLEVGNSRVFGIDSTGKGLFVGTVTANGAILDGGTNTFSLTNGTASLDVAAAAAVNIDKSLTVNGQAVTIAGVTQANTITLNESITIGGGYSGTLTYSAASKTLTVEDSFTGGLDLNALEALASTGLVARTAANTYSERTITGTAYEVELANGNGVSGNPTVSLPDSVALNLFSADSVYFNVLGKSIDGNQKNVTDLNKLNTDSTSAFVADGSLDLNQNDLNDVNEETADTVVVNEQLDMTGAHIVDSPDLVNLSSKGTAYYYTTNDYIEVADNANLDFGTGDFSLIVKGFRPDNITATEYIVNKEAGGIGYGLYKIQDDLYIRLDDNTADASAIIGTAVFEADINYNIAVKFDRSGSATAFVNGDNVGTVVISGSPLTLDNAGAFRIGCTTAGASFLAGTIEDVIPWNMLLSDAECIQISLGNIPAKYHWGSQTNLITNGEFTTNTVGWTGSNFTISRVDATSDPGSSSGGLDDWCLKCDADVASGRVVTYTLPIATVIGKKYRVGYRYYVPSGDPNIYTKFNTQTLTNITSGNESTKGVWSYIEYEEIATLATTVFQIGLLSAGGVDTDILYIDAVKDIQIGAVLAMQPQNMTASTAYDASSNNLDGTVSGATLLNAKVADAFNNPNKLPTDDAVLSVVDYSGYDGSGNVTDYGYWQSFQRTVLNGDESWGLKLSGLMDNSIANLMEWDLSGAGIDTATLVFNEGSRVINTRFEGDGDANLLYIDGANDKVGIGTSAPDSTLTVSGSFNVTGKSIFSGAVDVNAAATATSFTADADVTGATVASITAANLLDKSATESISGVYTFTNLGGALVVNDSAFVDTLTGTVGKFTKLSSTGYGSDNTVSDAELLYINSLSSNAQDQFNLKAPLANPTFTGSFTSPGIDDNADAIAITIDVTTEKVNFTADTDAGGAASATSFAADANLTGNNTAYASSAKLVYKKVIYYGDAASGNIILFDANAVIWSIKVNVTEVWDSSVSDVLDIGVTAVANQYQNDLDIRTSTGWTLTTAPTVGNKPGATYVTYAITSTGDLPGQGTLEIYIEYSLY